MEKKIPVSAGLGGGSGNAAAVLRGLNTLFQTGLSLTDLRKLGEKLGADVPFCISGGTVLAEGIGEKLSTLRP
ncbi:MAG: 4-(cytidine 5'-diphospho)-2-C-methyl-D-erythritol kinase, partial [Clostridiales bacterium]|nr:4-(cytidine 5'-diphospho)-2-C-methyl-D-erythritol kinase [Clostridiales bacterium]